MSQDNDTPQAPSNSPAAQSSQARGFLRRHRLGLFGAGLFGMLGVAGIAKAGPHFGHSTYCMGHHHEGSGSAGAAIPDANGKVLITADEHGFHPSSIEITKGQKVILEFRRTSGETCATSFVFPELKLEKPLPLNQTVAIDLPAEVSSTLTFQCGMGMYRGKIVVH
jgi:hypothetical protein